MAGDGSRAIQAGHPHSRLASSRVIHPGPCGWAVANVRSCPIDCLSELENLRPSIAMLRPQASALDREEAITLITERQDAEGRPEGTAGRRAARVTLARSQPAPVARALAGDPLPHAQCVAAPGLDAVGIALSTVVRCADARRRGSGP
jgi:hypothetical protein